MNPIHFFIYICICSCTHNFTTFRTTESHC